MAKNTKPAIRFKGFTDAWEQRKLGEIAPLRGGYAFQSNNFLEEGIPIVKISNILSTGEVAGEFSFYEELDDDTNFILPDKAAVLAMSGATTGKVSILSNPSNIKFYQNQRVGYFKKTDGINYPFISTLVRSQVFNNQLNSILVTGAQPNVSSKDIDDFDVLIPASYKEQKKIGAYFSNLDHLITLHQRKYDSLVNVKKAMLEKMFPKNGETVPEIRFKGFTDAWEQRKLGEVAENFEYGLNAAAKEFDGVNKYIRITDIDDESHQFNKEDLTSPDTNLEIAERYKLEKGDILFARTGASVGKSYIYMESDGLVYYAGFLIRGKIKEGFDTEFVFQNTLTEEYKNYIRITSQRSGQPGVNAQEYQEYSFKVPHYAEQKQIGMLFKNLDHLITLHQRKLEKLKNIKKSCLEKMFV